jgi:MFS family permease
MVDRPGSTPELNVWSGPSVLRSLGIPNYRLWAGGALVSNIGTWMQRTAQGWLVLTQLTHHDASILGVVTALQYGPQLLFVPWTGLVADRLDRRRLLISTQAAQGALALGLGALTVTGLVVLWHVYLFAFLLGCVTAFDSPARQTFVSELVGERDLANAVALNSTSANAARMLGPAAAGILIAALSSGWVFLINGASFIAVLLSLFFLRKGELHREDRSGEAPGSFVEGFRVVWGRADLKTILLMLLLIGMFGLNFPIFISTMTVSVFRGGSQAFGLLTSAMAIGSTLGAIVAAGSDQPDIPKLMVATLVFAVACALAAITPNLWLFGLALLVLGAATQTFTTSANSLVQLSTDAPMRGRVMAILLAVALGGTPVGAPVLGWVADHLSPRWALGLGAASGLAAALVALRHLVRTRAA